MQNPADLVSALVTKLRAIPELVAIVGAADAIVAYEDEFPTSNSILHAVDQMPRPSILVAWQGTAQAQRGWAHRFTLYVKAPGKYTTIWDAIANGVPAGGDGLNFRRTTIHANCYPVHGAIQADRRTLTLSLDPPKFLDVFEFALTLMERGANQ